MADLSNNLPLSAQPVLAIETVHGEDSTVFISFNYKVWKSTDLGEDWTELEGDLPSLPITPWYMTPPEQVACTRGRTWACTTGAIGFHLDGFFKRIAATVRVTELELYPGTGTNDPQRLRAGTYGRGMWETDAYGEPVGFPAIAFLEPAAGETSIYGDAQVQLAFGATCRRWKWLT